MEAYKREFIEFMVESDVLKFGDFTLKSGRKSPFFMKRGGVRDRRAAASAGAVLRPGHQRQLRARLRRGVRAGLQGHPLSGGHRHGAAGALRQGSEVLLQPQGSEGPRADAGNLLGAELHDGDKVIMVEDVTTSGKSIDETYPILKAAADVDVRGLIVSLNRMEVGKGGVTSGQKEIEAKYGFPVAPSCPWPR